MRSERFAGGIKCKPKMACLQLIRARPEVDRVKGAAPVALWPKGETKGCPLGELVHLLLCEEPW